jgi:uncharacterized protein (DUF2141 family)
MQIATYRLATLRTGLKLEIKGLRMSRGPTAYSILRSEYGYKGKREAVLAQVTADVAAIMAEME